MNLLKPSLPLLTVLLAFTVGASSLHAAPLDGDYPGFAKARIQGQKIDVPIAFEVKGRRLTGNVIVPGAGEVVRIVGTVNQRNGKFEGEVQLQNGITGTFKGKIKNRRGDFAQMRGNGRIDSPVGGQIAYRIKAAAADSKSTFSGVWVADRPQPQSVRRVDVGVTPQGVATISFDTAANQTFTDNLVLSPDGRGGSRINFSKNIFTYSFDLDPDGTFSVNYSGALGRGALTGTRRSRGGVNVTPAGKYSGKSPQRTDPVTKVKFTVRKDRTISGTFRVNPGSNTPFSSVVGGANDFGGTTASSGPNTFLTYFGRIAADGTFTIDYQVGTTSGTLSGSSR